MVTAACVPSVPSFLLSSGSPADDDTEGCGESQTPRI
jgi:hypothetical protein